MILIIFFLFLSSCEFLKSFTINMIISFTTWQFFFFFHNHLSQFRFFFLFSWRFFVFNIYQIPNLNTLIIWACHYSVFFISWPCSICDKTLMSSDVSYIELIFRIFFNFISFVLFFRIFEFFIMINCPDLNSNMFLTSIQKSMRIKRVPINRLDSKFMFEYMKNFKVRWTKTRRIYFLNLSNFNSSIIRTSG